MDLPTVYHGVHCSIYYTKTVHDTNYFYSFNGIAHELHMISGKMNLGNEINYFNFLTKVTANTSVFENRSGILFTKSLYS